MKSVSVAMIWVERALQGVRERHLDTGVLLHEAGIPPELLGRPHARIAPANFNALWQSVARALDDEFFGQDSRRMKLGSYAMLCKTLVHCKSVGHALERALRFFDLILDDITGELVVGEKTARIVIRAEPRAGDAPAVLAYETYVTLICGLLGWLADRALPVQLVEFGFAQPAYSAEYAHMFPASRFRFDAPCTALTFDTGLLALPVAQDDESVKDFLRSTPEHIVLRYTRNSSLVARIRQYLQRRAVSEWPDFELLADDLFLSRATLRRRLGQDGQSYQSIKDQLRRDLAIDSLCRSTKNMADIAEELGFAEPSAFHRAFKKWTGLRPGDYRRRSIAI